MEKISEIGKAMAKCYCSKVTTEVGDWKFEFLADWGDTRRISIYKNGELVCRPIEVIVANTILHREKLEKKCEERFGWVVLKTFAKNSELEGTDLYDYLSTKCVEEGISLDVLDKHSKDILSK